MSSNPVEPAASSDAHTTSHTPPPQPSQQNWRLPPGIEGDLEDGVVKLALGVALGGLAGMLLFKGNGKGNRLASLAAGCGVALGSTGTRLVHTGASSTTASTAATNAAAVSSHGSSAEATSTKNKTAAVAAEGGARIQKFHTEPVPMVPSPSSPRKSE